MEQLYLVEIFIDELTIYRDYDKKDNDDETEKGSTGQSQTGKSNLKKPKTKIEDIDFICKVKFGPRIEFDIREDAGGRKNNVNNEHKEKPKDQDDDTDKKKDDIQRIIRRIRAGKSYLFPSYPDTMFELLREYPLEFEVFNDDINETGEKIYVGVGNMHWDTELFVYLRDTKGICQLHLPLATKCVTPLMAECCCKQCGEISFIARISALGDSIVTDFKQMMSNPDHFLFLTNKVPTIYECFRLEGKDPNFNQVGGLYANALLYDPAVMARANRKIDVCTDLQSCGVQQSGNKTCANPEKGQLEHKTYPVDKIKMGDIKGPCGNPNCVLAHKVKMYIRNLDAYRKQFVDQPDTPKKDLGKVTKKVCGSCLCKDDKYHHEHMNDKRVRKEELVKCEGCGGHVKPGNTCVKLKANFYDTGVTPTPSRIARKTE